jgi:hypothetical protein
MVAARGLVRVGRKPDMSFTAEDAEDAEVKTYRVSLRVLSVLRGESFHESE